MLNEELAVVGFLRRECRFDGRGKASRPAELVDQNNCDPGLHEPASGAIDTLGQDNARAAKLGNGRFHFHDIVNPRRPQKRQVHFRHREMEPLRLKRPVRDSDAAEEIRPTALKETHIAAVEDGTGEIGVLVIDSYPESVPVIRQCAA